MRRISTSSALLLSSQMAETRELCRKLFYARESVEAWFKTTAAAGSHDDPLTLSPAMLAAGLQSTFALSEADATLHASNLLKLAGREARDALTLSELLATLRRLVEDSRTRVEAIDALKKICRMVFVYLPIFAILASFVLGGVLAFLEGFTYEEGFWITLAIICGTMVEVADISPPRGHLARVTMALTSLVGLSAFGCVCGVSSGPLLDPILQHYGSVLLPVETEGADEGEDDVLLEKVSRSVAGLGGKKVKMSSVVPFPEGGDGLAPEEDLDCATFTSEDGQKSEAEFPLEEQEAAVSPPPKSKEQAGGISPTTTGRKREHVVSLARRVVQQRRRVLQDVFRTAEGSTLTADALSRLLPEVLGLPQQPSLEALEQLTRGSAVTFDELLARCFAVIEKARVRTQFRDAATKLALLISVALPVCVVALSLVFGVILKYAEDWGLNTSFYLTLAELTGAELDDLGLPEKYADTRYGKFVACLIGILSLGIFASIVGVLGGPLIEPVGDFLGLAPLDRDRMDRLLGEANRL